MAHLLDMTRGRAAMAFTGEVPWHGLGAKLSAGAPLEVWQQEAGLDWEAKMSGVRYTRDTIDTLTGAPAHVQMTDPNSAVLYRSDNGAPLSIVSARYQAVQPKDIIEFYRDLTERHGFTMETAGALKDGRKVWALARTGETATLPGNDHMRGYLLLATSYDGSMATQARFTSIRVVCNNTLTAAENGKADVSVRHNTEFKADDVKIDLNVGDAWAAFSARAEEMARCDVSPADAVKLFLAAYHGLDTPEKIAKVKEDERKSESIEKFVGRMAQILTFAPGAQLKSSLNTAWGVMNACTFEVDHEARAHSRDNRLNNAWFGKGESVKQRMWQAINKYMAGQGVAA